MAPSAVTVELVEPAASTKNGINRTHGDVSKGPVPSPLDVSKDAASYLDPLYEIAEQPIGTRRPIRVACVGAGYSGLMMSIMFSQKMQGKNAELVVYERNPDLGGTWFENR
jgi:hypothetical protein